MRRALLALLASACLGGTQTLPTPVKPGTENAKFTVATDAFMRGAWEASGFFRVDTDMTLSYPVYVAFASDHTACLIEATIFAVWRYGDFVQCKGKWRFRRPD